MTISCKEDLHLRLDGSPVCRKGRNDRFRRVCVRGGQLETQLAVEQHLFGHIYGGKRSRTKQWSQTRRRCSTEHKVPLWYKPLAPCVPAWGGDGKDWVWCYPGYWGWKASTPPRRVHRLPIRDPTRRQRKAKGPGHSFWLSSQTDKNKNNNSSNKIKVGREDVRKSLGWCQCLFCTIERVLRAGSVPFRMLTLTIWAAWNY